MKKLFTILAASAIIAELSASTYSATRYDAVTAATVNNECQFVYPIATTGTSALITWKEKHSGGTAKFSWGLDPTAYSVRAVTGAERSSKSIQLTGLTPETTYFIRIEMTKPGELPYAAVGSFTTLAAETKTLIAQIVQPIAATESSAVISWTESAPSDSVFCLWGTDDPPTTARLITADEHQTKTFSLGGLSDTTRYFVQLSLFKTDYPSASAMASFYTNKLIVRVKPMPIATNEQQRRLSGHRLMLGSSIVPGDCINIMDLAGRRLTKHVVGASERSLSLAGLRPQVAVITIRRGATSVVTTTFIIGQ